MTVQPTVRRSSGGRVTAVTRGPGWWYSMVSPLLAVSYLEIAVHGLGPGTAGVRLGALVVSALSLAGFGYLINDWCDITVDRIAKKPNLMGERSPLARAALVGGLAVIGAVPWLLVSAGAWAWGALGAIYVVPLLYSVPPVRLKQRGVAGAFADAANAHLVPTLFVLALFSHAPGARLVVASWVSFAVAAGSVVWAAAYGFRAIAIHQLADLEADTAAGVPTFVRRVGPGPTIRLVTMVVFPIEVVALLAVLAGTWVVMPAAAIFFSVYAILFQLARVLGAVRAPFTPMPRRRSGYELLSEFYDVWPATALALALIARSWWFLVLVAAHGTVFWRGILKQSGDLVIMVQRTVLAARRRLDGAHP